MEIFLAIVLVILLMAFWALTLFGLPGNWLSIGATALYAWLVPAEPPLSIGWGVVLLLVVLAVISELIEFFAGAAGATKMGGSKRGAVLAIVGSIIGAIIGLYVGLPIPVVGSIIASLLMAALGALMGAILGELWKGRNAEDSLQIGMAAFWGRLLGTAGKLVVCFLMLVIVVGALLL